MNEDLTNLVFGVLLIAIMIFWQGRSRSLWQSAAARWRPGRGGPGPGRARPESEE